MARKDSEFEPRVEYKKVIPGWNYVIQRGDGTAVKGWAPTREKAEEEAARVMSEGV